MQRTRTIRDLTAPRAPSPSAIRATDPAQASHFVDIADFAKDAAAGDLPAVAFLDPTFVGDTTAENDEHPPANIQLGQAWVYDQVKALMDSPEWKSSVLFITYFITAKTIPVSAVMRTQS